MEKRELTQEFKKYADLFYEKNQPFFSALVKEYEEQVENLKTQLNFQYPCELEFEQLITISCETTKEAIIELGLCFSDLKKAVRKKEVSEFLVQNKGISVHFLKACEEVGHYYEIKDSIVNIDNLLNPIKDYRQGNLDEEGMRQLYMHISSYQNNFNNHHLKKYALRLFGMPYKELIQIKEDCFEQTYNCYATISISKEGTIYTKKDGTQSR